MGAQTKGRRLIEHRSAFRVRDGKGSLLRLEELSDDELELIAREFYSRLGDVRLEAGAALTAEQLHRIYSAVLHEWGVMCPHPMELRTYPIIGKSDYPVPFDDASWYRCGACGCSVINR